MLFTVQLNNMFKVKKQNNPNKGRLSMNAVEEASLEAKVHNMNIKTDSSIKSEPQQQQSAIKNKVKKLPDLGKNVIAVAANELH